MITYRVLLIYIITVLLCGMAKANPAKQDSVMVSLLTCWPGPEIYELCGHSAIRVQTSSMDSVWNYGLFNFNEPNFVYRFVKGETDYMVGGENFESFIYPYMRQGRKVVEQRLNLTDDEARKLLEMLRIESLPENRTYRYNYVYDNCATRISQRVAQATGKKIIYPDTLEYGTFRREMRAFHENYPWYQFGIDLALGAGIDVALQPENEMFVPVVMSRRYDAARLADGRPLVKSMDIIFEGSDNAVLSPTPFYLTPLFISWVVFVLIGIGCVIMITRKKLFRWIYCIWFLLCGIGGCVISFLVFISEHEATSPNILIFWLNPLQLIIALGIWWKSWRIPVAAVAWFNIVTMSIMLLMWPFQLQSANPAFFPLIGSSLALSVVYAILCKVISYNKDRKLSKNEKVNSASNSRPSKPWSPRRSSGFKRTAARNRNSR